MTSRTLLRQALWAVPVALSLLAPSYQALAQSEPVGQSEQRQFDLNKTLQNSEQSRAIGRQLDQNAASQQLQQQQLDRQIIQQQNSESRLGIRPPGGSMNMEQRR